MQFCPKCDNVLLVKRKGKAKVLHCPSCGHELSFNKEHKKLYTLSQVIEHGAKDMTHVAEDQPTSPVITEEDRDLIDDDEVESPED